MVDADGDFIGEVCHIEAAEAGGQRFNPDRTNEQNRNISNLMLMCRNHHKKTDNTTLFPVGKLAEIKKSHEAKFMDIGEKMANAIKDSTDDNIVVAASNLNRINRVLDMKLDPSDLDDMVPALVTHAQRLERVPELTRNFLGAVAARMHRVIDTGAVYEEYGTYKISVGDIEQSLSLSHKEIEEKCKLLEHYGLGGLDDTGDWEMPWVVTIRSLDGWALWVDLAAFAKATGIAFSTFWKDLDFSSLDE
ncbi:hypothetical protein [Stenotrophomonas maltophilia]|uniref:hypothetical protein n=1 Tax=Stenotrophomonas maltophilia TaxID=40324 RepID=UPI00296F7073|nr:hypothetical protein [Stenotrophomonas maltophilia]HEL3260704.1 hypothetical protein [Stenotrophomonas maltophilia]